MSFCTKCGGANDPSAGFCRTCGAALPVAAAGTTPGAAVAPAPAVKKSRTGLKVVLILLALFIGLPIVASIIIAIVYSGKSTDTKLVGPSPTVQELTGAQQAGLSKEFATESWLLHRYLMNMETRSVGVGTDEGLEMPSDEALRVALASVKKNIHSKADDVAFQRMSALLWAEHLGTQVRAGKDYLPALKDPRYKRVAGVAEDCFAAVNQSFKGDTGFAVAQAIKQCLAEKKLLKDDMDKQGVSNWDM